MRYETRFTVRAQQKDVFDAFHHYKTSRDPSRFFPTRLAKMNFSVVTDHALGLGAVYDWDIRLLGLSVLGFREQIVEWQAPCLVAYRAISGWQMLFRIELGSEGDYTTVSVAIEFSLGLSFLDQLFRPFVEWGLKRICRRGLRKEGISQHRGE